MCINSRKLKISFRLTFNIYKPTLCGVWSIPGKNVCVYWVVQIVITTKILNIIDKKNLVIHTSSICMLFFLIFLTNTYSSSVKFNIWAICKTRFLPMYMHKYMHYCTTMKVLNLFFTKTLFLFTYFRA